MVFVREIKKAGKVYRYKYKSKRVDGKVKSIYLGKELVSDSPKSKKSSKKKVIKRKTKSPAKKEKLIHRSDKWIVDKIVDFNKILEDTKLMVIENKVEAAVNHYNRLLKAYEELHDHVSEEQKMEIYNKTREIYDSINKINL